MLRAGLIMKLCHDYQKQPPFMFFKVMTKRQERAKRTPGNLIHRLIL